jgi:hypothetical protein
LKASWRGNAGPRAEAESDAAMPPHIPAQCTPPSNPAANAAAASDCTYITRE